MVKIKRTPHQLSLPSTLASSILSDNYKRTIQNLTFLFFACAFIYLSYFFFIYPKLTFNISFLLI